MKICYIGDVQSIHMQKWAKWFADKGHDVHLITDTLAKIDNVKMHPVIKRGKRLNFLIRTWQTRRLVRKIKPDILHAHYVFGYGLFGVLSGFHPFVVSPWGSDIVAFPEKSVLHKLLIKYVLQKTDLIQCTDESVVERVKSLIEKGSSIYVIKWGIDTDLFTPQKVEKDEVIKILYLRKSQETYGVETLLHAIPEIISRENNVQFLIRKSGEELNKTVDTVKKLKIEKYVEFVEDLPNEKIPKLMNSCDIYVDTAYSKNPGSGIGMTAFEAMSCELPVVLSNTAGVDIYIKHKINGYIYKGHDSNSLADAIMELVKDQNLREELGKNAREYIVKNQNFKENMKIMESFYEKLANGDVNI